VIPVSAPILEFIGIEKSFFGVRVLHDVSFTLHQGHVLGLIGENGAGKSTLMNILGGVIQPDAGQLKLMGEDYAPRNPADATRSGIGFIHQELNLFTNLSVAENLFIDGFPCIARLPLINRRAIRARTKQLLDAVNLSVSQDTPVERLSPGERQLVEIARALNTDARIIIFDEPATSLTIRETERLFDLIERLREQGKSIIYISHILADVQRLSDEIVVLRDGEVVGSGPKEEFTINRMISLMVGRNIEQLYPPRSSSPTPEKVLEVKGLSQNGIVEDINLTLHKGEVLGIFGLMGSGRTELARILFGLDPFRQGEVWINGKLMDRLSPQTCIRHGMAFVTENRREEGLLMDISIAENMALVALPRFIRSMVPTVDRARMYAVAGQIGRSLQIKSEEIERQEVRSLSGGNQQKVVIGKWLMAQPSVLILDEPTRGVDVGAKYEIYTIIDNLAARGTGVLVISSEIEELIGICDRILVMSNGEIQGSFDREEFDQEKILRTAFRENVLS
jgi:ribose transport system ATP-binding protein